MTIQDLKKNQEEELNTILTRDKEISSLPFGNIKNIVNFISKVRKETAECVRREITGEIDRFMIEGGDASSEVQWEKYKCFRRTIGDEILKELT